MTENYPHFKDKDAIGHVVEAQAAGIISAAEIHGTETPGFISAAADAARDTAVIFLILLPFASFNAFLAFLLGWTLWKAGRASLLGWSRLERLHRVLAQEKWEIEHNRSQERDELRELYRAKGFEGKLLEDVLDVLMADSDRLLKVMIEEELGLSLQNVEHPLKQGIGAGIGSLAAGSIALIGSYFGGLIGLLALSTAVISAASALLASYSENNLLHAVVWNISIALLGLGTAYYTMQLL